MRTLNYLTRSILYCFSVMLFITACNDKRSDEPRVLVFSKTAGFYHESIPEGIAAIQKLGNEHGFQVDTTTRAEMFTEENLMQYAAVIWLSTTGDVLNHVQEADFERYIQSGGGYVGIHAATDTEYGWGWYGRLAGAQFLNHPGMGDPHPNVQDGTINVTDRNHPSTQFLPESWDRRDEWYSFKKLNPNVNVLMYLDEESYQGGHKMGEHPLAWYHEYDGGRAFYTGGGHTRESYQEELFLEHILEGIKYAIGDNHKPNFNKATTQRVPEENRFEKIQLSLGEFTEPTEMTILPNLDILIAQRRGEILLYKQGDTTVREVAKLDVFWKAEVPGVNAEEGLMGLQKDPNFKNNHYVFAFYAPSGSEEINRLSRFTFANDEFDLSSEKVILEFYSQRNICCHTGGSIAFDKDGLLYLSTGDNSTPFDQPTGKFVNRGFAPLDDRPGFKQFDARRSAGNSNDLRGKILRIKVNEDGSYDIPEGNLYPKGTDKTRPEIYIQGNRNPYRISIDQKTGYLYWGEVGPDANSDSLQTRGPRGYDEVNQARAAGNYGWPFFVANNLAYVEYDYGSGESGRTFDAAAPRNDSPHNTGLTELPEAQPAFIWYPYGASAEFPQVGTGGRNSMTGPVYYSDMYTKDSRYPSYYDGKLFIYDWVRGWIKAVTMTADGDFDKMEPFMSTTKFNALMDMEVGPDGKLYILEYGNGWFTKNPDSGLFRIDFNDGNRSPIVGNIQVDKTSGSLPFTAVFTVDASDPEQDPLTYKWDLGNGETVTTQEPMLEYTFEEAGDYDVKVQVSDPENLTATSGVASVYAGNIAPEVTINIQGNQSFYFPGEKVSYEVSVSDPDDADAAGDLSSLYISADYISGMDQAEASQGHLVMTEAMMGKSIMSSLTCKSCHKEDETSIGPSYTDVARRYRRNPEATAYLVNKIQQGGGGVWGETVMPANPELKFEDGRKIVAYILSLAGGVNEEKPSMPSKGKVDPTAGKAISESGLLVLSASYTDRGAEGIKPLTGNSSVVLRNPKMGMEHARNLEKFTTANFGGRTLMTIPKEEASFSLNGIDLTGIKSIQISGGGQKVSIAGYEIEIRLDSPTGTKLGAGVFKVSGQKQGPIHMGTATINIDQVQDGKKHDIYILTRPMDTEIEDAIIFAAAFNN
ncbi:ThuA domain-containing protein [Anditalea andensis]|uniref:Crp/Fnr family transcriptional regulator n=1 Tax=Anditalea andensis TaxID=1048983 RepID=A0A074KXU4_9BACT|nr:ThuA domain-containing protein [Anditalea andensis]KEO73764.1 Crp/Fnr family transcriptional regulator [Anditalea andensis]